MTKAKDINKLRVLQDDFTSLKNVTKIESILNVSRVISQGDDILVSKAIPTEQSIVTDTYLEHLAQDIHDFPELSPYVSDDLKTILFYVYYGNYADSQSRP